MPGYQGVAIMRKPPALLCGILLAWAASVAAATADKLPEADRAAADAAAAAREGTGIPALSEGQQAAYLDGRPMWMASAAELNQYPDPHRVLELATALELTEEQQQVIAALAAETRAQAVDLGKEIIAQEQKLNRIFAWHQATAGNIEDSVFEIGLLQALLRHTHLAAHIRTRELLTETQVERYAELQGRGKEEAANSSRMGCNAAHHHGR